MGNSLSYNKSRFSRNLGYTKLYIVHFLIIMSHLLLTPACTIICNHNKLQELTIIDCLRLTQYSFLFSRSVSLSFSHTIQFCNTYTASWKTHRKHICCPSMDICKSHKTHLFLFCCIYSTLNSKRSYLIVAPIFVAVKMCLLSHYLEMGLYITIITTHNYDKVWNGGPLSLMRITEELLEWKRLMAMGICYADHETSSICKKLSLTSPTCGGRSISIVCCGL
jgi:hypothetical protein